VAKGITKLSKRPTPSLSIYSSYHTRKAFKIGKVFHGFGEESRP